MSPLQTIAANLERLQRQELLEVLRLIDALIARQTSARGEDLSWSEASLASALRGMEDEPELYTEADLRERYP